MRPHKIYNKHTLIVLRDTSSTFSGAACDLRKCLTWQVRSSDFAKKTNTENDPNCQVYREHRICMYTSLHDGILCCACFSLLLSLSLLLAHGVARICCLYFPIETFFSFYIIDFQQHEPETASKNNKHEYHYGH